MHRTRSGATIVALVMSIAGVTSTIARASNDLDARGGSTRTIVFHDEERITPSALTMTAGDVLEFQNDSGELMRLIFVEPPDQDDSINCYLADHTIARPDQVPWLLFDRGPRRRLTATIPPGKFPSVCSLAPGQYTFVTVPVPRDPRDVLESLGIKGTITVE